MKESVRRFAEHAHVVGAPHIRLYASTPLVVSNGSCIGCLCALTRKALCPGVWSAASYCLHVCTAHAAPC